MAAEAAAPGARPSDISRQTRSLPCPWPENSVFPSEPQPRFHRLERMQLRLGQIGPKMPLGDPEVKEAGPCERVWGWGCGARLDGRSRCSGGTEVLEWRRGLASSVGGQPALAPFTASRAKGWRQASSKGAELLQLPSQRALDGRDGWSSLLESRCPTAELVAVIPTAQLSGPLACCDRGRLALPTHTHMQHPTGDNGPLAGHRRRIPAEATIVCQGLAWLTEPGEEKPLWQGWERDTLAGQSHSGWPGFTPSLSLPHPEAETGRPFPAAHVWLGTTGRRSVPSGFPATLAVEWQSKRGQEGGLGGGGHGPGWWLSDMMGNYVHFFTWNQKGWDLAGQPRPFGK